MFVMPYAPDQLDLKAISADPSPLEALLAKEAGQEPRPEGEAPESRWARLMSPLWDLIPAPERDILELYYFQNATEHAIGEVFGISQAAVSYKIKRGRQRLQLLRDYPGLGLTLEDWTRDLGPYGLTAKELTFMAAYAATTCCSEAGRRVTPTWQQSKGRHIRLRIEHDLEQWAVSNPALQRYVDTLRYIAQHGAFLWDYRDGAGR